MILSRRVQKASLVFTALLAVAIAIGIGQSGTADITGPSSTDHQVTNIVTWYLQQHHLSQKQLDDEISQRGFDLFLRGLDPQKIYFHQSDIDTFTQNRTQLDDMLKRKDTTFAYMVFERFLKRVDEHIAVIDELLDEEIDFTVDEELITERDLRKYARTEAEARENWRKRIKFDLMARKIDLAEEAEKKAKSAEDDEPQATDSETADPLEAAREKTRQKYHSIARRMHQFDNDELLETFLTSITNGYDPHTSYMSPNSLRNFRIMMSLKLEGIGAQLQDRDGHTIVAKIVPGGAADKGKQLKAEDEIVSVGQGTGAEMLDVVGMKLTEVVSKVRGKAGTVVRLGVQPAGGGKQAIYDITRAEIDLMDSAAQSKVFDVESGRAGASYKVGMIDLPSFYLDMEAARHGEENYRSTTRDVKKILDQFRAEHVDAVVLDLRRNGGGSLTEAINLTGLFIDQGPVVQVMDSDNVVTPYDDPGEGMAWSGPLVVLTSKFSASASEILAGAIQDYQRGLVIGDEATHGKGTVQSLVDLGDQLVGGPRPPNLGALKITMQQFFRPNGASTQKQGVLSDIILPSVTNYMDVSESDLDYAFDFRRVKRSQFSPVRLVPRDLLKNLQDDSAKRIQKSEDFGKLIKRIESYREQKDRDSVTLNEAQFLAERAELNAQKEDEEQIEKQVIASDTIERDFYLDEVFLITRDYTNALRQMNLAGIN